MSGNLYLITRSTTFIKKQVKDFKFYLEFEIPGRQQTANSHESYYHIKAFMLLINLDVPQWINGTQAK